MDPEAVGTLSSITGLGTAEAEGFLEMGASLAMLCHCASPSALPSRASG